jgi:hypothetical protein
MAEDICATNATFGLWQNDHIALLALITCPDGSWSAVTFGRMMPSENL